uniref:Defence against restriction A C-terminal domain-containing protein n=1 Tax=viral metagenome TaxID=1070528 RepID=A0A6M3LRU4_9ZZZZ
MNKYYYACTHRPPSPGAVPRGFIEYLSSDKRGRYGVIAYTRILTDVEVYNYELKEVN